MNKNTIVYSLKLHANGLLNSYSQLFLADSSWFAVCIIIASFIDVYVGLYGVFSLVLTNFFAHLLNYSHFSISKGYYGFNSLLVGFFVGYTFQHSWQLFLIMAFISFVCFVLTIVIAGLQANKKLPYLSLPFLFTVWLIQLAAPKFGSLVNNDRGIFVYNEILKIGGTELVKAYHFYDHIELPRLLEIYLKSLGAIVFQYNIVAGALIVIGLLIFSRIAFMLSIIGFFSGYYFYSLVQGDLDVLNYTFIGFNFILTAIAIGGYFLLANSYSFLLVIIASPIISILIASSVTVLSILGLSVFSLPFNIGVTMVLYFLYYRTKADKIKITQVQLFSPEKNLYRFLNEKERFDDEVFFKIGLPFYGEWVISQGHNGLITHKNEYQYAWDFVIKDDELKTFRLPGTNVEDYYCYALPVLAPADGYVIDIIDGVEDNLIGDVNLKQNWGNTIIIKHADNLFSKISHIKKDSFKVFVNDFVHKGQMLAHNGSSGRSPEPHIHFQLQSTPALTATTIKYPLSNYVTKYNNEYTYKNSGIPSENDVVSNAVSCTIIKNAFNFIPGKKISWKVSSGNQTTTLKWEVYTDINNQSYLYCHQSKAMAWFVNDGTKFYFTTFEGNKKTILFDFYTNVYKVVFTYYQDLMIEDSLPIYQVFRPMNRLLNDFLLPFKNFLKANYKINYYSIDDYLFPKEIKLNSEVNLKTIFNSRSNSKANITILEGKLDTIQFIKNNKTVLLTCEN